MKERNGPCAREKEKDCAARGEYDILPTTRRQQKVIGYMKKMTATIGLAAAIMPPAAPAAGRVAFGGEQMEQKSFNCHVQIDRPNGWPERSDYQGQWCHSDMKDVAYFFNFKFYKKAVEKGDLK